MKKLILFFLLFTQTSFSQSKTLDDIIEQINFQEDTILSVYNWITDNIKYDVAKLRSLEKGDGPSSKYKSQKEYEEASLAKVISKKKGVCQDYSLLFDAIVSDLGYSSFIVEGMSKNKKGKIDRDVGHQWNAILVDGNWTLYDATWGAGYVTEKGKFVKSYNAGWFAVTPDRMQKDHLPYDPLWQLSTKPLTYDDFVNSSASSATVNYDFNDLIDRQFEMDNKVRLQAQLDRSEEMGEGIRLVKNWRKRTKKNIEFDDLISQPNLLDDAIAKCQAANKTLENYSKARNKNFKGRKWTKEYAKQELLKSKTDLESALVAFESVDVGDNKFAKKMSKNISSTKKMIKTIDSQIDFLDGNGSGGTRRSRSSRRRG